MNPASDKKAPGERGEPIRVGSARGRLFRPLESELLNQLEVWMRSKDVPDGEAIKPGRVYRRGDLLLKFIPRRDRLRDRLRTNTALRAARLHYSLVPIRTPAPYLALEGDEVDVLVSEFIEGQFVEYLWKTDEVAMEALVVFMDQMRRQHVFHGDFHFHNMIWNGEHWYLIDLESLRHRLRTLLPRRLIIDQCARLSFCLALAPDLERHFKRYLEVSGLTWDASIAWSEVESRAQKFLRIWGEPPVQPD